VKGSCYRLLGSAAASPVSEAGHRLSRECGKLDRKEKALLWCVFQAVSDQLARTVRHDADILRKISQIACSALKHG
jgi:hypothetical protein